MLTSTQSVGVAPEVNLKITQVRKHAKGINPGFGSQGKHHQSPKQGNLWPHKRDLSNSRFRHNCSEISLEMEALNICKDSLISMGIETFDRLRSGLNSFHGELLLIGSPHKR